MNPTLITEELSQQDVAQLLREVERYLAAVDAFRAEGFEPRWLPTSADPRASATR